MGKGSEASSSTGGEGPPARGHSCPGCPSPEHTVAPAMPLCSRRPTQQAQSAAARPASDVRDANGTRRTHPAFWRSSAWVIELAMLELDVSARGTVGDGDEDAGRRRCWESRERWLIQLSRRNRYFLTRERRLATGGPGPGGRGTVVGHARCEAEVVLNNLPPLS